MPFGRGHCILGKTKAWSANRLQAMLGGADDENRTRATSLGKYKPTFGRMAKMLVNQPAKPIHEKAEF